MTQALVRAVRLGTKAQGPLIVLLHGLGSNERDLMAFAPYLDPEITVVSYRAPRSYGMGGYSWFDIQWLPERKVIDQAQADESREILVRHLSQLREEFQPTRLILGGFSQGAMMTLGTTLAIPDQVDGAMMMSGRALSAWDPSLAESTSTPFLVQHGTYDDVIAVEEGREASEQLKGAGFEVTYREYAMGHEVNMASLEDAIRWLHGIALTP